MTRVVDFHVHVFPDNLDQLIKKIPMGGLAGLLPLDRFQDWRRQARRWIKPVMGSLHDVQTHLRYLPEFARKNLDELSGVVPLPGLFVESTLPDLKEAMTEAGINRALLIAHPPFIPNE